MTYKEAMEYIKYAQSLGSVLGLETMNHLMEGLGNPHNKLKFVHVAGTNGKGSTAAFIASILAVSNYSVGRYISPSVLEYEEKIQISHGYASMNTINTWYIGKEDITKYMSHIKDVCEDMVSKGLNHPTLFEIETAMAFLYFVEQNCDIVVLEVGLGGRLDATNVIKTVECSVITSISMDHMGFLGDTLEAIAKEKAGIIKLNVPVVSYEQKVEVSNVLKTISAKRNANYTEAFFSNIVIKNQDINGTTFDYLEFQDLHISLLGLNQVYNCVVAIHAIMELRKYGYDIWDDSIHAGIHLTKWRGRFEIIKTNPYFIVDGAHNEDAAKVLSENIKTYFADKKLIYIMGVLGDKDYYSILEYTGRLAHTIITITPNNERGLNSEILATVASDYCSNIINASNVSTAITRAYDIAGKDDIIITFGSLSFLGEVYTEVGIA